MIQRVFKNLNVQLFDLHMSMTAHALVRSRMRFLNEWRFARAVLRRGRELRSASGSSIAARV